MPADRHPSEAWSGGKASGPRCVGRGVAALQILLIPGSLRRHSTNVAALRTAALGAPPEVVAELFTGLGELPLFNPDADEEPLDPAVVTLRAAIRAADALVFSTPEYAGALPGPFKNLLDWTVGDDRLGSIYEKPVAWVNVSPRGAPNAHDSLRRVLGYVHAEIVESACAEVPVTPDLLDEDGLVTDASVRAELTGVLVELAAHVVHGPDRSGPSPGSEGPGPAGG